MKDLFFMINDPVRSDGFSMGGVFEEKKEKEIRI